MKINLQHQIKLLVNDIVDFVPVLILSTLLHIYHMSITFLEVMADLQTLDHKLHCSSFPFLYPSCMYVVCIVSVTTTS